MGLQRFNQEAEAGQVKKLTVTFVSRNLSNILDSDTSANNLNTMAQKKNSHTQ